MKCSEYENLITDYLEGEATPVQRSQMYEHISECETCRVLASQERAVMERLNALSVELCPDAVIDSVMKKIPRHDLSLIDRLRTWLKSSIPLRYGFASLAGSAAIVLLVLFLFVPDRHRITIDGSGYTTAEIEQATLETKLALAYFAVYSRKTERAFEKMDLTDPVIKPIENSLKKAIGRIPYI